MKNKKKLLIAVAAMGLLAVGTAGVGTAAWYQAGQALQATSAFGDPLSVTTAVTDADNKTVYAKFELQQGDTCKLTNKEGHEYYVNAGSRVYKVAEQPSLASGEQYGTATFKDVKFYNDSSCTDEITASAEKALINTASALSIKVTGGNRTRVALHAPTALGADFYADDGTGEHHGFGASLGNYVTFSVTITAGVPSGLGTVYYAVNGTGTTLVSTSDMDTTYVGTIQASWNDGAVASGITQNLTVANNG